MCLEVRSYGTSRQFAAARNLVAAGAQPTLVKPATNELDP